MSVKRYDFDCYAFYDSARLNVQECDDGDYVLHSDYAELEARHNALVEAARPIAEWWRGGGLLGVIKGTNQAIGTDQLAALAALVGEG